MLRPRTSRVHAAASVSTVLSPSQLVRRQELLPTRPMLRGLAMTDYRWRMATKLAEYIITLGAMIIILLIATGVIS